MFVKRLSILALLVATAAVSVPSSAGPIPAQLQRVGYVQGSYCFGPSWSDCDPTWANDETIQLSWYMEGTWSRNGKLTRSLSWMETTATKIGPKRYSLNWFWYDVRDRRFGEIFEQGRCDGGTLKIGETVSIDVDCTRPLDPAWTQTEAFSFRIRAVNERRVDDVLTPVVATLLETLGLEPGCGDACPSAPFDGVYF